MTTVITKVSDEDREIFKFFSQHQPCWFKGCEDMRAEYFNRLDQLGGAGCSSCQKSGLVKEFHERVKTALQMDKRVREHNEAVKKLGEAAK
jgi:hypothetical protein